MDGVVILSIFLMMWKQTEFFLVSVRGRGYHCHHISFNSEGTGNLFLLVYFLFLVGLYWMWIVVTLLRLVWRQKEFSLVSSRCDVIR